MRFFIPLLTLMIVACTQTPEMETALPDAPANSSQTTATDPNLWLEEVEGEKALAWVRAQNERSLAELQADPRYAKYEAAALDGAGPWKRFVHVTLPQLAPTTLFLLITSTIFTFQGFDVVRIMTQGGPVHDDKQRIIQPDGTPIPNLYSAGEMGSLFGHLYISGGNLAECFIGGRRAGQEAASAIQKST